MIGPKPGYWRSHSLSESIYPCFNSKGCLGSFEGSDYDPKGTCSEGYSGRLCATCESGYTRSSLYQCRKCPPLYVNILILLAVVVLSCPCLWW